MEKKKLIDGVAAKFLALVESGYVSDNERIIQMMEPLTPGVYDAYILGGKDAVNLIRGFIEELYEETE